MTAVTAVFLCDTILNHVMKHSERTRKIRGRIDVTLRGCMHALREATYYILYSLLEDLK